MGGVKRAHGAVTVEGVKVIPDPAHIQEIAELKEKLLFEREKPAKVIEKQVKTVVEKLIDDPRTLERLNAAMKEISELKSFQPRINIVKEPVEVVREVVKYVDRVVSVEKKNHKLTAGIAAVSLLSGLGLSAVFNPNKDVNKWEMCSTSKISKAPGSLPAPKPLQPVR